jgi:ribA/ribD-fused uncharacterized protein
MENSKYQERIYNASEIVFFKKTKEAFGGLSNMAAGFPLEINGVPMLTSEALYQACRFPHLPEVQQLIIKERSPMTAKMIGKPYRSQSREDFEDIKVEIMRWCLRVKLAQNFIEFGRLLLTTNNKPIVEDSHKDSFWGAVRDKKDGDILRGVNALGRLLMQLREQYLENPYSWRLLYVEPLKIPNFKLFGEPIGIVDEREKFVNLVAKQYGLSNSYSLHRNMNSGYTSKPQFDVAIVKEQEAIPIIATESEANEKINKQKVTEAKPRKSRKAENPTLFASK